MFKYGGQASYKTGLRGGIPPYNQYIVGRKAGMGNTLYPYGSSFDVARGTPLLSGGMSGMGFTLSNADSESMSGSDPIGPDPSNFWNIFPPNVSSFADLWTFYPGWLIAGGILAGYLLLGKHRR